MEQPRDSVHRSLILDMHIVRVLFAALKAIAQVIEGMLEVGQPRLRPFGWWGSWLGWRAGLRGRLLGIVAFPVHERVSTGSALDLAQTHQVTPLEVSVPMLELPQRCIWISGVKYVAFYK